MASTSCSSVFITIFRARANDPAMSMKTRVQWISGNYYVPAIAVVVVSVIAAVIIQTVNLPVTELIFLPAVLVVGLRWGLGPSIWASFLALWAYAVLFSPLLTNPDALTARTFVHFGEVISISLIVAVLSSKARRNVLEAEKREHVRSILLQLSHEVAVVSGMEQLTRTIVKTIRRILERDAVLLLVEEESLKPVAFSSEDFSLSDRDMEVAYTAFESGRMAGYGTEQMSNASLLCYPLQSAGKIVGVLGLVPDRDGLMVSTGRESLLEALLVTIAAAVERESLAKSAAEATILKKHEELYTALLSSISHDFRTPLASIIGAVETLALPGAVFSKETELNMLSMVREEAQRLNRFVSNLLDMTKLEAGRLKPNFERLDVADVIGTAIHSSERILKNREITVSIEPSLPMIHADFVLLEHVLTNLLENAAKYSDRGTPIHVEAGMHELNVVISVLDQGQGIPQEDLKKIFEKFYRVQQGDLRSAGTGLGLSICSGIVESHGGLIRAESPVANGMGTRMIIELPVSQAPEHIVVEPIQQA